jgi:hypothetical protein
LGDVRFLAMAHEGKGGTHWRRPRWRAPSIWATSRTEAANRSLGALRAGEALLGG